jgi:tetratricopeptide (TPR) repeat protein
VVKTKRSFNLTTAIDDQRYSVIASSVKRAGTNIDLAVVQFRSNKNYSVAKIGDSNLLKQGTELYVAGFPVLTQTITQSIFAFREGRVTANSNKVFKDGYSLVYSNSTLPGMSGGAVLNKAGELVAIHGKGDRTDENQKTDFNLGIPINRFGEVASGLGVQLGTEIARVPKNSASKADDYYVSASNKEDMANYRGALADYNQAIALDSQYAEAYSSRGRLKGDLNDFRGAIADYNQAIAISRNPTTKAITLSRRGVLKGWKLNDVSGALADLDQAIRINPSVSVVYINRGVLKDQKLNDIQGALADYNKAISLYPQFAKAYYNRGLLKYKKLNDSQGALADYNKALSLNPKFAKAYYNRGLLKKVKLNDSPGAISDYRAAARIFRQQGQTSDLKDAIEQLRRLGATE